MIKFKTIMFEKYFSEANISFGKVFFQSFRVFIAKSFSKLKTNIRNGFPIEFRIDIGVTGSPGRQNSPKPLQNQNMDKGDVINYCVRGLTSVPEFPTKSRYFNATC